MEKFARHIYLFSQDEYLSDDFSEENVAFEAICCA